MSAIRLVIVDDSSFVRRALTRLFEDDPQVRVAGSAESGEELVANWEAWRPDVVTLDLHMPGMGGLSTLDWIMAAHGTPVIILSSYSRQDAPATIEALAHGAADFVDKHSHSLVDFAGLRSDIRERILTVARRRPPADEPVVAAVSPPVPARGGARPTPLTLPAVAPAGRREGRARIVAIGASTGGPAAVQRVLRDLGPDVRVPVAIVQHMPVGFTAVFAERLTKVLGRTVREPVDGERLEPGVVYVGRAGVHLLVRRAPEDPGSLVAALRAEPRAPTHRPSVDVLFGSVVEAVGGDAVAALLTGMGDDGAHGLAALALHGAATIAQDEASCVVFGMPRAAIARGAAREVLPLDDIGARLRRLVDAG